MIDPASRGVGLITAHMCVVRLKSRENR